MWRGPGSHLEQRARGNLVAPTMRRYLVGKAGGFDSLVAHRAKSGWLGYVEKSRDSVVALH